jgi:hypothetical protein
VADVLRACCLGSEVTAVTTYRCEPVPIVFVSFEIKGSMPSAIAR